MFDDLKEYLREWFKKVITSRLFVLAVVFCLMSSALVMRLFNLQIIKGEEYQDAYTAMTEKVIKTASTRGNIYDRNGNVLAYNELSICMGLRHIQKKADRVLLFPADVPMITADTIEKMAQAPGSMAVPVCQGKKGHPVMLSKEVFGHILTYRGGKGLRGAMDAWGEGVREIEVEDPGVLLDTNTKMDYESLLAYEKDRQKRGELAFRASISLSREEECFSALTADFLEAVAESGSMLGACQIRDISYSKGWKMLKIAEAQLGIQFLERQTGGSKGGFSVLTPEGKAFLEKFRRMEAAVQAAAEAAFEKIFLEPEEEEKEDTDGREINAF